MTEKIPPPWSRGTSSQLNASQIQPHQIKVYFKVQDIPQALIEGKNGFIFKSIHKDTGARCTLQGVGGEPGSLHILIEHTDIKSLQRAKRLAETMVTVMENSYTELCHKKEEQQKLQAQKSTVMPPANPTSETRDRDGPKDIGFKVFKSVYTSPFGTSSNVENKAKPAQADYNSNILLIANWNLALSDKASSKLSESGVPMIMINKSVEMYDIVCLQNTQMNWGDHKYGRYSWYTSGSLGNTNHGVAILVNNQNKDLKLSQINRLSECVCAAMFIYKGKPFKIVCCYLPHAGNPLCPSVKSTIVTQLSENNMFTILLGDFNAEIGTSDLTPNDIPRMGSQYAEKSNENGLFIISLSRSSNLTLASSSELDRSNTKYHVFVNPIDTFECKVFNLKKANSPAFAHTILKFALRPYSKNDQNQPEPCATSTNKPSHSQKNESTHENLWKTQGSNVDEQQISSQEQNMISATEKSKDSQSNLFKRAFQETNTNPFEKFQPKLSKMDPNTTSSFQNTQSKLVFAEQTIDSSVIQRSNLQLGTLSKVTEPKVERTCNANITETKQILERKPVSGDTLTTVQDQLMEVKLEFGETVNVWVYNSECLLRLIPQTLDSFYASIGYQLFPCITSESELADLSRVLQQRTINFIRSKKRSFFNDICNLYKDLFPDHGYDSDFAFEHGCLYLLSKSGGGTGERITAQAIASLFTIPIVILEESKCEQDRLTLGRFMEILPESGKSLDDYGTVIVVLKRKIPENHYDIFSNLNEPVSEFLKLVNKALPSSGKR